MKNSAFHACRLTAVFLLAGSLFLLAAGTGRAEDKEALISAEARLFVPQAGAALAGDPTSLLFPLDGSYSLVDFFGDGATGNRPAQGPDQHNDDDSATVPLPFTFDLYGDTYTTAFVNNNGNLSFDTYFSTYTGVGFPSSAYRMVAPFWADVDTGSPTSFIGDVWQKVTGNTLIVIWDNVGYYNQHGDKVNTFEVAISDGTNPAMGLGNNVCFSYDDMQWTTGDASGGSGGFGGSPSTVGANRGNGVEFFQIGRFDHEGVDYDGPDGSADGVSYLDGQAICFNTATTTTNIAPIPTNFPPGNQITIDAAAAEMLDLALSFLSPEAGQTTTVAINDVNGAVAAGLSIVNTPGNVATVALSWYPSCTDAGSYALEFTATDDFNPPGVTAIDLTIDVGCIGPADTPTLIPTDTPTLIPTDTPTLIPTDTPTLIPTDTPTLIPTVTPTGIPTGTAAAECGLTPFGTCRTARKSMLILQDKTPDKRDKLLWKWTKGAATSMEAPAEFGDPISTTSYALCIYHGGSLLMQLQVPPDNDCAGRPCWKAVRSFLPPAPPPVLKAYKFRDKARSNDGIGKVLLRGGEEGKAKILVKAKRENLPDPGLLLNEPVTVELINNETGVCWGDTYSGGEIKRNDAKRFKAKARN